MNVKKIDSTKIYWLDKEETVKAKLVGLDLPHGFGSVKYTFRVIHGGAGDVVYMDSNLPKTIHEVAEQKKWQFTTPIAMKCTEEQFNGIKDRLVEMGYTCNWSKDFTGTHLTNNMYSKTGFISNTRFPNFSDRLVLSTFNPDLFLALAAMTDKEDGIKGECFKCVDIDDTAFGSLYIKTKENFSEMFRLDEKELVETGFYCASSSEFRKATAQEIIEHFEKKEFVLQPRWYVELTHENYGIVKKWHESIDDSSSRQYIIGAYYGVYESGEGDAWTNRKDAKKYQIITTDQFKKYVLKELTQSCQIIPIPPTKQATLFDDRVEITDWKPKDGAICFYVGIEDYSFVYKKQQWAGGFHKGLVVRTESEAKQLVEKLKQAML